MKCGRGLWIKAVPALAGLIVAGLTVICPDGGRAALRRAPADRSQTLVRVLLTMLLAGACVWLAATPALAQPAFEAPPVLSARELLPPDMLTGVHFEVDDRVPTDGLLGHFTLRSGFGTFVAPGRELLRIRIAELSAIQQLEATSQTQVFLQAAGNAAERPIEAVVSLVTDPVQTIQGIPAGISRFFDRIQLGAQSIAKAASDPTKTEQQRTEEAAQRIGSATITALGFEQVRRQLAKGLGADPYTTNPVLSKKLTDIAWVAFSGRLGVNLLTSAFVPGSTAISGLSFTHDLVYDTSAADLIVLNKQKMLAMGATDAQAQALLSNKWFSLSVLTALVTELERLDGVGGRPYVLALAATATKEEEARFLAAAVHVLARLNVGGVPIRRVITRGTVVGITPDGAVVVPAPVDYVSWTDKVGTFAARSDLRAKRQGIWLAGRMSGAAQQGFTARGWTLHDVALPTGTR